MLWLSISCDSAFAQHAEVPGENQKTGKPPICDFALPPNSINGVKGYSNWVIPKFQNFPAGLPSKGDTIFSELRSFDASMAPGNIFDKEKFSKLLFKDDAEGWFKLPAWLPGEWRSSPQVLTYKRVEATNEVTHGNKATGSPWKIIIGIFDDASGQVWSTADSGGWAENVSATDHACFISHHSKMVGANEFHASSETASFKTDRLSQQIIAVNRGTSETIYYLNAPDQVLMFTVRRSFDWQGNLNLTTEYQQVLERTGAFRPQTSRQDLNRQPLYPLFVQYLKGHGLDKLIPVTN